MSDGPGRLHPAALIRAGREYPVAAVLTGRPLAGLLVAVAPDPLDPALLALGEGHLAALRSRHPAMHDGPVLRWLGTDPDGRLRVCPGGYFATIATCDALRAEWQRADPAEGPMRRRVHELTPDPLRDGSGRAAALGLSVLLTVPTGASGGGRGVVLGRRSARNATDVGKWHVAPSGMVEPATEDQADPIAATLVTELAEEVGVVLEVAAAQARGSVLGLVHDLLRLRPDVVVRLDLDTGEAAGLRAGEEFEELAVVPLADVASGEVFARWGPDDLTAPAAGALELLRQSIRQSSSADCQ